MSPSERAAVDQAHRQFGEPTATPKPRAGEHRPTAEDCLTKIALAVQFKANGELISDNGILKAVEKLVAERDELAGMLEYLLSADPVVRSFREERCRSILAKHGR